MTLILSPNKHTGRRAPIRLVVLHTMEVPETSSVAEAVGRAFADPNRQASAHVGVDTDSECRYVADADTAWAAPGANADGLQLEMAGRAGQSDLQWVDGASKLIIERAAQRTALWCKQYAIPARHLTNAQLADGQTRGIVGHKQASDVFKLSSHWDPGPRFPWASFLARVTTLISVTGPHVPSTRVTPTTRIKLTVDGAFGPRSKGRLQQWAGTSVDSFLTRADWQAVQRKVGGLLVDGVAGPKTWVAIQRLVGASPDGDPGPKTYSMLQTYLNAH